MNVYYSEIKGKGKILIEKFLPTLYTSPMKTLKELYRIGIGPSSSHTMGPRKAAEMFLAKHPEAKSFEVTLYGSLAATGNEINGYNEHTATLWREFKLGRCGLRLQAEIINLTDAQYDVIKYYPMPGRSWRLTGTFNF